MLFVLVVICRSTFSKQRKLELLDFNVRLFTVKKNSVQLQFKNSGKCGKLVDLSDGSLLVLVNPIASWSDHTPILSASSWKTSPAFQKLTCHQRWLSRFHRYLHQESKQRGLHGSKRVNNAAYMSMASRARLRLALSASMRARQQVWVSGATSTGHCL